MSEATLLVEIVNDLQEENRKLRELALLFLWKDDTDNRWYTSTQFHFADVTDLVGDLLG